jgi:hypothetical protein
MWARWSQLPCVWPVIGLLLTVIGCDWLVDTVRVLVSCDWLVDSVHVMWLAVIGPLLTVIGWLTLSVSFD